MVFKYCLLVFWAAHASAEATRTTVRVRPLIPCQAYFDTGAADSSEFTKRILDRYARFKVTDVAKFGGHQLSRPDSVGQREVPLPDLMHTSAKWRIEQWRAAGHDYYFYDVGSRNLDADAADLHAALIALLQDNPTERIVLNASETRRRDLENLQRFQSGFTRRTRDALGRTLDGPPIAERSPVARTLLSNSDLFGILDRRIDPSASRRDVERLLLATIKVTYDQAQNFVQPNYIGLMDELGLSVSKDVRLPLFNRVHPDKLDRFRADLKQRLGEDPGACELSPMHLIRPDLPAQIKRRLLFEVFNQARRRKCKTMVTSLTERVAPFFVRHGFTAWRRTPNRSGTRETTYLLHVNSPEFNAALHDLHVATEPGEDP